MAYMLLVVEQVGDRDARTESEGRALYDQMLEFSEDLNAKGQLALSQSLKAETAAVRVSHQGGKSSVRDGPFAEAKEMIGGFFLLNVEDLAQAVEIAGRCPAARWATVEVRELGPCFQ